MISKAQPLRAAGTVDVLPTPPDERRNPMSPGLKPALKRPPTPRFLSEARESEIMAHVREAIAAREATVASHARKPSDDTTSGWSDDSHHLRPLWLVKVTRWLKGLWGRADKPEAAAPK